MAYKKLKVEIEFIEPLLGTASANPDIHSEYIASKAADDEEGEFNRRSKDAKMAEEIAAIGVEGAQGKAMTVFARMDDGETPCIWDYHVKGYFKDACKMLKKSDGTKSKSLKAYKQEIDGLVHVFPRKIALRLPEGAGVGEVGKLERPLRASTAQGERVCLSSSETVPEGTTAEFEVTLMRDALVDYVKEWLDYGELRGMGQWRNAGWGRFMYRMTEVES
jgi:hypothetical protein